MGSKTVTDLLLSGLTNVIGAFFAVEPDPHKVAALLIRLVGPKRQGLDLDNRL